MLASVLGDNLVIHEICGFLCSFSSSNFPCRFCKILNANMRSTVIMYRALLRKREKFKNNCSLNHKTKTGLRGRCDFNDFVSFHVTEILEADILRDFHEGILYNVMTFIKTKLAAKN